MTWPQSANDAAPQPGPDAGRIVTTREHVTSDDSRAR